MEPERRVEGLEGMRDFENIPVGSYVCAGQSGDFAYLGKVDDERDTSGSDMGLFVPLTFFSSVDTSEGITTYKIRSNACPVRDTLRKDTPEYEFLIGELNRLKIPHVDGPKVAPRFD
jgi:hypothetical protein